MRFSDFEREQFARDGFVIRESVFSGDEVEALRVAVEDVAARVTARATREGAGPERTMHDGHRIQSSSMANIQWEWRDGSQEIRLVEPCTHLDDRLDALWNDARFIEPMKDALAVDDIGPFTSKLNLKRAKEGSPFPFHQDYPYWYMAAESAASDIATAILYLDDARAENGAVRVVAGSHHNGPAPRDPNAADPSLADPAKVDLDKEVIAEAPAGSVLFFGALLVHRSAPNTTGGHRRALLLSYQPAGRPLLNQLPWRPELLAELP
ncbi:MAG TPA: phytanoyl-CoA dioxygenase family protein [Acidimicrobiales bacterium]|nr:phytanoyl-CoA dioxygenase family protein [Acidimicrobiales bacterium]